MQDDNQLLFNNTIKKTKQEIQNRYKHLLDECSKKNLDKAKKDIATRLEKDFFEKYVYGDIYYHTTRFAEFLKEELDTYNKRTFEKNFKEAKKKYIDLAPTKENIEKCISYFNRPMEELITELAEYHAWQELKRKGFNNNDKEVTRYRKGQKTSTVLSIETTAVTSSTTKNKINTQHKRSNKANLKKINKPKFSKMKINLEYSYLLQPLYNALNKNYIDEVSYDIFQHHFDGNTSFKMLNWIATDYEFVYLFDRLNFMLEDKLYFAKGTVKLSELKWHFKLGSKEIKIENIRVIRSNIKKNFKILSSETKKNLDAINTLIQDLKNKKKPQNK